MNLYHAVVETPLGWVAVLASDRGVRRITLPQKDPAVARAQLVALEGPELGEERPDKLADLLRRLVAFYSGEAVTFQDIHVDYSGRPPFFVAVWEQVRRLPRGHTATYGEIARRLGKPAAARAVGRAMATNPVPPVVPCHRVVGRNGHLVGFGGGLEMKATLLQMEGARPVSAVQRR